MALFGLPALGALLVSAVFVPRYLPGEFIVALPYLVVGWASFALAYCTVGWLVSSPAAIPNVRAVDAGIAV